MATRNYALYFIFLGLRVHVRMWRPLNTTGLLGRKLAVLSPKDVHGWIVIDELLLGPHSSMARSRGLVLARTPDGCLYTVQFMYALSAGLGVFDSKGLECARLTRAGSMETSVAELGVLDPP